MIYFQSDYSLGASKKVLEALIKYNEEHNAGYGLDSHSEKAAEMIRNLIDNKDANVHFMVGGTPTNVTVIASALKPYQGVIAVKSGHIWHHETGAVEATGHRVITVPDENGKLTLEGLEAAYKEHEDEHTVMPGMVYISQPTECGSIYSKAELEAIYNKCKEYKLPLFIDGARLGSALTCEANDISLPELAKLCDAFYIGGTKNGALLGEALVILDDEINENFRYMMKRQCGLLAKGALIGIQFEALFEGGMDSEYFKNASIANNYAKRIREELSVLGIKFFSDSPTNQVFPVLPVNVVNKLKEKFLFYEWAPEKDGYIPVRFVTSFGTTAVEIDELISTIKAAI